MNEKKIILSEGKRFRLLMGKVRRFYYIIFRRRYVNEWRKLRRGSCNDCGACCYLSHKCLHLRYRSDGSSYCSIYKIRPVNCRAFPIDPTDLHDRNIIMPNKPCGYWFEKDGRLRRRR